MTALQSMRGANFWSRRPVTRMDLVVGAFDEISSAQVPGVTDALVRAMPGLVEHHCSIGERGGFVLRLRRGTYAPHIVEHVALELQTMMGHEVGYGRTRGGDTPGEYTLVFEHLHEQVGLRAAALALEIVQRAFAGTLEPPVVESAVAELAALARTPDTPPVHQAVLCGITGGSGRAECQSLLLESLGALSEVPGLGIRDSGFGRDAVPSPGSRVPSPGSSPLVVDVSPSYLLQAGLPYARSEMAIVLGTELVDVPERYREPDRARRVVSILIDAVRRGGLVICPAGEEAIESDASDAGCRVAVFAAERDISGSDLEVAAVLARVRGGRLVIEHGGDPVDAGPLRDDLPRAAQLAAALAVHEMRGARGEG